MRLVEFKVFVKDPDYNIILMSIFLGLTVPEGQKQERSIVNGVEFKYKYPEVVTYRYIYKGGVENPNASRHDGRTKYQIVLQSARVTTRRPIQVYAFFRSVATEMNAYIWQ